MELDLNDGSRLVAVSGHPGLYLLTTDPARYPEELLVQLAHHLARAELPERPIAAGELRSALRLIGRPALLGQHPLALWTGQPAERRGAALEAALRAAIARLEQAGRDNPRDRRGAIVQLRYLAGLSVKELRGRLYLSESHYHRLHAAALEWLARDLAMSLKSDLNMGDL